MRIVPRAPVPTYAAPRVIPIRPPGTPAAPVLSAVTAGVGAGLALCAVAWVLYQMKRIYDAVRAVDVGFEP